MRKHSSFALKKLWIACLRCQRSHNKRFSIFPYVQIDTSIPQNQSSCSLVSIRLSLCVLQCHLYVGMLSNDQTYIVTYLPLKQRFTEFEFPTTPFVALVIKLIAFVCIHRPTSINLPCSKFIRTPNNCKHAASNHQLAASKKKMLCCHTSIEAVRKLDHRCRTCLRFYFLHEVFLKSSP